MSWVTAIWATVVSVCLLLTAIYFLIWWSSRAERANLLFALTTAGTAGMALCELGMMHANTPAQFALAVRWLHVAAWVIVVMTVGFVRVYFQAGRSWLAWTTIGARTVVLLLNFLVGQNLNYYEVTGLRAVPFLGDSVATGVGVSNPWMLLGQLTLMLFVVFVADAVITVWRRGNQRRALLVGTAFLFFVTAATTQSMLVLWQIVPWPLTASLFFLGVIALMGYELSRDVLRSAKLVRSLRASEQGLFESEQRMSLVVDAADFGIWVRDLARNEIWASERWRELYGFTATDRLEMDDGFLRVHPDDREAYRATLARAATNGGRYETDFRVLLPDGRVRWISSCGRSESDATGHTVRILGVSRDVTRAKQAEEEILLLRQGLAHAGRVSMMGQLATTLAHEINQPLGAILRNSEAAELFMQNESPDLEEIRAILKDIREDDQRAAAIIARMRALLGRRDLNTEPLDVAEMVGDVVTLVQPDAVARHVRLEVDVPGDLPLVLGERVHLQQVLLNLILNGLDAIEDSSREYRRVSITVRRESADTLAIAVTDTGKGIAAQVLPRLFDPFFTTKPNGIGMGLPISRTLIEAHGGRLWAKNNDSGGAAFLFTVPIAQLPGNGRA